MRTRTARNGLPETAHGDACQGGKSRGAASRQELRLDDRSAGVQGGGRNGAVPGLSGGGH